MDGRRTIDGRSERTGPTVVNDTALYREIESLLSVEPSPQFVARVRARVAQEPEPGQWHVSWLFAVAGAVAVVIVALIAWPSRELASGGSSRTRPTSAAAAEPRTETMAPAPVQPIRKQRATARVVAVASPDRAIDIDLPEVMIADNEVKAYTTLVSSIRWSRFDVAVPAAPDPNTPLEVKELPPVEPLEIEPIVKLAARQPEGEGP